MLPLPKSMCDWDHGCLVDLLSTVNNKLGSRPPPHTHTLPKITGTQDKQLECARTQRTGANLYLFTQYHISLRYLQNSQLEAEFHRVLHTSRRSIHTDTHTHCRHIHMYTYADRYTYTNMHTHKHTHISLGNHERKTNV